MLIFVDVKTLFVLSHVKLALWAKGLTPSPYNNRPLIKVVAPVPPLPVDKVPADALETFKLIKPAPEPLWEPLKFVAFNILLALSHVKLVVCKNVFALLPINKEPRGIVDKPVPPLETDNVPFVIFEAFKADNPEPSPTIPPRAKITPLKVVAIAREYA